MPTWIADIALTLALAGLALFENSRLDPNHELLGFPERDDGKTTPPTDDDPSLQSPPLSYDEQIRKARSAVKYTLRSAAAQIYDKGSDLRSGLEALCRKYGRILPTSKQQVRQKLRVLRGSLDQHLPISTCLAFGMSGLKSKICVPRREKIPVTTHREEKSSLCSLPNWTPRRARGEPDLRPEKGHYLP